jgi:hypothetical protein
MKIYIGPFKNWVGPYQIVEALFFWQQRYPDEKLAERWDYRLSDRLGDWLASTPVTALCQWIEGKRHRTVRIRIDKYDTWNADSTLSMIALPMLRQLHQTKHGAPMTDDDDVPAGLDLRSTEAPPKENEYDVDDNHFRRWDWIMDEMIWTFEQLQPDCDWEQQYYTGEVDLVFKPVENSTCSEMVEGPNHTRICDYDGLKAHDDRIANGLRLFGKYYRALWD